MSALRLLLVAAVLALAAPVLCKDPPPPTLRAQTTMGQISTQGPGGLFTQLPFTMRMDPDRQMALISFQYLFQNIQAAWNGEYVTVSLAGDCDTDYFGDFPFKKDMFFDASYSGQSTITTPYYTNLTASHFTGELDIDYYYYYYYYDDSSNDSIFYKRDVDETPEEEVERDVDQVEEAEEASGIAPGTATYDIYTMFTNPDFVLRWVLYVLPGVPGTVIDYQSYDYAYIPDAAFQPQCYTRRDVREAEEAVEAEEKGEEGEDPLSAVLAKVMSHMETVHAEVQAEEAAGEGLAQDVAALELEQQ
eukprot:TRINITY_DN297_c0_g1_i1.p2 TRINITY_DN297_c0_g1~~TRINITY_DN297_c0_g1_i1.p2  ORF type:complete len:304 (-),score=137.07 TRINITY_DN297_c0_g1_i1:336-1247(-)